jgi:prenyltransferase beta subunit
MLQVARLAPKLLGESAELVLNFLRQQQNKDGGFKDRTGKSDLYYTVFGLDGLLALEVQSSKAKVQNFQQARRFLDGLGPGEGLDFVHLCCLARAWATISSQDPTKPYPADFQENILRRIERFRSKDGGYSPVAAAEFGTAYGCFLAVGAYQDMKTELPARLRLVQCLKLLETKEGGWANERNSGMGSTNATAAASTVLRNLSVPINQSVGDWLLAQCHREGGFLAAPNAPIPDLLSTATALHALAGMQISFERVKEKCLDFIDTLWTNEGGFHGNWSDEHLDCEYTYYGLLALGHLSL